MPTLAPAPNNNSQLLAQILGSIGRHRGPIVPAQGVADAGKQITAALLQKRQEDKAKANQASIAGTQQRALAAMLGGVKEFRNPDSDSNRAAHGMAPLTGEGLSKEEILIPGQQKGLAAMAQVLGGNPLTSEQGLAVALKQAETDAANREFFNRRALDEESKAALAKLKADLALRNDLETQKAKPERPQTVDVNGNVHILKPDGTLGPNLGPADKYVVIPGVGAIDANGKVIGAGGTAQNGPSSVPAAPASPASNMSPKSQEDAQKAEIAKANSELRENRKMVAGLGKLERSADRFLQLSSVQNTGGLLRQIPGSGTIEGAFDPQIKEMTSIVDKVTPQMRDGLPGSASNFDVAMFRGAAFGVDKDPQTNRNIIMGIKAHAQNQREKLNFKEVYLSENKTLRGAEKAWQDYLNNNPIFNPNSSPERVELNSNRQRWQDYMSGVQLNEATGFTVKKVN